MVEGLIMGGASFFCALAGVSVEAKLVGVPEGATTRPGISVSELMGSGSCHPFDASSWREGINLDFAVLADL
jgi:hypothetical protein